MQQEFNSIIQEERDLLYVKMSLVGSFSKTGGGERTRNFEP